MVVDLYILLFLLYSLERWLYLEKYLEMKHGMYAVLIVIIFTTTESTVVLVYSKKHVYLVFTFLKRFMNEHFDICITNYNQFYSYLETC